MPWEPLHAQGAEFKWGTTSFNISSFSLETSIDAAEIDITSMSSRVFEDPENTKRKLIARDFDSCFSPEGGLELKVEFLTDADLGNPWLLVGQKRALSIRAGVESHSPSLANFFWNQNAILTSFSGGASTGEFIRGSATFKLTD